VAVAVVVDTSDCEPFRALVESGFSASTEITRTDFGVSYNGPIPGGGVALAEKVQIVLDIEADLADAS
jgi:polyisoprenoid-binding protein YceI